MEQEKLATLKDIAQAANVSLSTVSRALHSGGHISAKTRQHIQAVAQGMGYQPNIMARSLRLKKSNMLMVLIPDIANLFHANLIKGIEKTARAAGYSINIISTDEDAEQEKLAIQMAYNLQADGILTVPIQLANYENITKKLLVLARHDARDFSFNFIANDDVEGAFIATNHLIERGCRKVFFVCGPAGQVPSINRLSGYQKALAANGIPFDPNRVIHSGLTLQDGYDAFIEIALRCAPPYGIFCFNDNLAIGVLHSIRSAALATPKDVSVVGYDDISMASFLEKPLTTVRQADFNMGSWGAETLINMIRNPQNYTQSVARVVHPELIVRQTT